MFVRYTHALQSAVPCVTRRIARSFATKGNEVHVTNPYTRETKSYLADTPQSIRNKYIELRMAQRGWGSVAVNDKDATLRKLQYLLKENQDSLADSITWETGKGIDASRTEVQQSILYMDQVLGQAEALGDKPVVKVSDGVMSKLVLEPLGVVASVAPWSSPVLNSIRTIVPALLCGNTVLFKAASQASGTVSALTSLVHASGIPEEVFQCVLGSGTDVTPAILSQNIDALFAIGSHGMATAIGKTLGVKERILPIHMSLAGNSMGLVLGGADIQGAATDLARAAFVGNGQVANSIERIYIETPVYEDFRIAFQQQVKNLSMGDPSVAGVEIGACQEAWSGHLNTIQSHIKKAVAKGAKVDTGGQFGHENNALMQATVVIDCDNSMELVSSESFAPLVSLCPIAPSPDDIEALQALNQLPFASSLSIYTAPNDAIRSDRIMAQVTSGMSGWNTICTEVVPPVDWTARGHAGLAGAARGPAHLLSPFCSQKVYMFHP